MKLKRRQEGFSARNGDKANNVTKRRVMEQKEKRRRTNTDTKEERRKKSENTFVENHRTEKSE